MTIPMRRVAGSHDLRMDGITDLVTRARGCSVLDIGCNRGLAGFEMAMNGAVLVHGCDIYEPGIQTARELFADLRAVQSRFEVVDLRDGAAALANAFGDAARYDIVLMLATYHKIKRVMSAAALSDFMRHLGEHTDKYFGWRATGHEPEQNEIEMAAIDRDLAFAGLKRVHTSYISAELGLAAIWAR